MLHPSVHNARALKRAKSIQGDLSLRVRLTTSDIGGINRDGLIETSDLVQRTGTIGREVPVFVDQYGRQMQYE